MLCLFSPMNLTVPLSSNGYRITNFLFSLLSTEIVNIMENSLLYPSSSLNTVSTLWLVIGHREVPLVTSHLWLLRVQTPHSSASVLLSLLFGARNGIVTVFLPPHLPGKAVARAVQSLLQKGTFELTPLSSLSYYSR